jgi:hypothetical protein
MSTLLTGAVESFKKSSAVRSRRHHLAAAGALALALLARPAFAEGDPPSRPVRDLLHLTEGRCLRRASLAAGVASWLARDTLAASIAVDVDEIDGGGRFVVRREGEVLGRRTLLQADSSCEELRAALSLAIAVAIDATILDALGAAPAPAPAPAPTLALPPPLPPPPPLVPTPPPSPPPPRKPPSRLSASLEMGVLAGLLPAPAFLISPSVSYAITPLFELRLAGVATTSADAALLSGGASFRIAAARLDACAVERRDALVVRACAGALAGGLTASGFSYSRTYAPTSPWIAVAGRIDARWAPPRNRLGLVVALDGLFTPQAHDFEVHDAAGQILARAALSSAGAAITAGPVVTF